MEPDLVSILVEKFRARAEYCRDQADHSTSSAERENWLIFAARWLLFAKGQESEGQQSRFEELQPNGGFDRRQISDGSHLTSMQGDRSSSFPPHPWRVHQPAVKRPRQDLVAGIEGQISVS
jgi:hypothetical protein